MSRSRTILSSLGLGAIGLASLTACPIPASHYEIEVGPDEVLAADVQSGQFDYWILDSAGNIVEEDELVVTGAGSVTVHATDSAGLYVTTPTYSTAPAYSVAFDGSVKDDAVFSYLDTDEAGFEDIRSGDPVAMFAKHGDMIAAGAQIKANWELDRGLQSDALITLAYDEITSSQSDLQAGVSILLDSDDLDAAEAGTSGLASWATGVEDEMALIEPQAIADTDQAADEASVLNASTPDPAALQAAIEDCLELTAWADELEAALDKAYPEDGGTQYYKDEDYDGKGADGELERDWVELEAQLEAALELQEVTAEEIEHCVELAIGGEPAVDYTETDSTTYEIIGANSTALAEGAATDAYAYEAGLEGTYADAMDGDTIAAWGVVGWIDPADAATALIEAEIGSEMFAESGGGAPLYTAAKKGVEAKADSSFDACASVTPVFEFNLVGLAVFVGTPFDDTVRGNDVETGFEVMWGGKGDDCLNGLKGHELIMGGPGNDELHGGDQHELIVGGSGDDAIFLGEGEDYTITLGAVNVELELGSVAFGGSGNDYISGGDPDYDENDTGEYGYTDLIFGDGLSESTSGEDEIDGGAGIDFLFGQWGDDDIRNRRQGRVQIDGVDFEIGSFQFGGKGDDELLGSDKFDLLIGSKNDDEIFGMGGLDIILAGDGSDEADGGDGLDLVFGGKGDDPSISGGDGIDLVMGNSGDDVVNGGPGALDLVFGNSGDDHVSGDDGFDVVFGGTGSDHVDGNDGLDLLFGGSDNDTVTGGEGIDLAFGGSGRDRVEGDDGAVDLLFGNSDVDIVIGGLGLDVLFGNGDDDWISGEDGVDLAFGGDGDDVLFGGNDLDVLFGNDDDDCVWGNAGVDFGFGGEGADQLMGGTELDLLVGSSGNDLIYGEGGVDFLLGGDDEDEIDGGTELGVMFGGDDDDQILGGATLDLFFAGDGDDCVTGGAGFDIGFGGDGDDATLGMGVGFGGDGEDEVETTMVGFGGDDDDVVSQVGTTVGFIMGSDGADSLAVDPAGALAFVFGGEGDDTLSATGGTSTSSSSTTRAFLFGGKDADWVQGSRGKSFAFGQKGDDIMSADTDGGSSNDDKRDRHWGNSDSDEMYGDSDDKRDRLYRGSGSDPSRSWDAWPSTSPAWGTVHATPSFATCPAITPPSECDALVEPPKDVGAQ